MMKPAISILLAVLMLNTLGCSRKTTTREWTDIDYVGDGIELYDALTRSGVPAEFFLVPAGGHGPGVLTHENFEKMTAFFRDNVPSQP